MVRPRRRARPLGAGRGDGEFIAGVLEFGIVSLITKLVVSLVAGLPMDG
jgi:hypothetical protein